MRDTVRDIGNDTSFSDVKVWLEVSIYFLIKALISCALIAKEVTPLSGSNSFLRLAQLTTN